MNAKEFDIPKSFGRQHTDVRAFLFISKNIKFFNQYMSDLFVGLILQNSVKIQLFTQS